LQLAPSYLLQFTSFILFDSLLGSSPNRLASPLLLSSELVFFIHHTRNLPTQVLLLPTSYRILLPYSWLIISWFGLIMLLTFRFLPFSNYYTPIWLHNFLLNLIIIIVIIFLFFIFYFYFYFFRMKFHFCSSEIL
jgi:hypothetical protein